MLFIVIIHGEHNIAQGRDALFNNTAGANNIAQGSQALPYNTTGNNNIAQGSNALFSNTSGNNNIAQGYHALSTNIAGSYNIAIGGDAGSWIKGNGNVHIGSGTSIPSTELDDVVLIGRLTNTLNATTANDNVILLGDTSSAAPKVGVGTYKPQAKLHVEGNIKVGNENNTCNADTEGSIRYNKPTKQFQGCDGTNWVSLN